MANFVDPTTGVMCYQSVEVQTLDGDVNPSNYLENLVLTAAAYNNNMQNLVRGCAHEAFSSAEDPVIDIIINKNFDVDQG